MGMRDNPEEVKALVQWIRRQEPRKHAKYVSLVADRLNQHEMLLGLVDDDVSVQRMVPSFTPKEFLALDARIWKQ